MPGNKCRCNHLPYAVSLLILTLLLRCAPVARAILQTAELDIYLKETDSSQNEHVQLAYSMLASQASFGSYPSMIKTENPLLTVLTPPSDNPLLCDDVSSPSSSMESVPSIVLVPRGVCTFEVKAWNAQQLGAKAILIYGTLSSRYGYNDTLQSVVYPQNYFDYDCQAGRSKVSQSDLRFDPQYDGSYNDPLMSGNNVNNLCWKNSPDHLNTCASKACLLTGNASAESANSLEACCAWDLHIWLYSDTTINDDNTSNTSLVRRQVDIPASYLTMQQGNQLLQELKQNSPVQVVLSSRWRQTTWNPSSFLIWMLGVFVATVAARASAQDYHVAFKKALARRTAGGNTSGASTHPRQSSTAQSQPSSSNSSAEESMELTAWHALGFIVMASTSLLVLFYLKIYSIVKVFYALGCSKAVTQVIFYPLFRFFLSKAIGFSHAHRIVWRTNTEDFGDISVIDIVAHVAGFALGITWLVVAFTVRHAESLTFFWIVQDIFGASMCIMFLQVIKLNSIHVASILLLVAFFYDIFFVFLSPLLFQGKSVMITVATSGGPPTADPAWCEKYPEDHNCQGGDPLPMLLTVPRINDYMGGSSLLGLGDIVLPGLLLSFAARFDGAKSLLGVLGGGHGSLNSYNCPERKFCFDCRFCSAGYFWPMVVAYAVGLFMANAAVYLMEMGQPALLYLVPCCLGTIAFMGWRRGELKDLWDGPKCIRAADNILYGESSTSYERDGSGGTAIDRHSVLPTTDDERFQDDVLAPQRVPSAIDGDGDLPLLEDGVRG